MNTHQVIAPSAIRTADHAVPVVNTQGKACHLVIDMTAVPGVETVTVTIQGKDPASGKLYTILASTALVAVATTILKVGPGLTAAANLVANDVLPHDLVIDFNHSAAGSFTYSAGLAIID
jgi:hypothetical protein